MLVLKHCRLRRSHVRQLVRREMQASLVDKDGLKVVNHFINSKNTVTKRIAWFVIFVICFSICCYQTRERYKFYMSGPFKVDIKFVRQEETYLPTIMIYGLDTPFLSKYWSQIPEPEDKMKYKISCVRPMGEIIEEKVNIENYTELWMRSNISTNLRFIRIIQEHGIEKKAKILQEISFKNRTRFQIGEDLLINYKNYIFGNTVQFKSKLNMVREIKYEVIVKKDGQCKEPLIMLSLKDDTMPYRYSLPLRLGVVAEIYYFLRTYQFLPTRKPNCEPDKKKQIQCYKDCVIKKESSSPCRLPYLSPTIDAPDCSLESNKSIISEMYKDQYIIEVSTLASLDCGCLRPCQKLAILPVVLTDKGERNNPDSENYLNISIKQNDETFIKMTELYIYSIPDFLVDLGGNLGFSLGISLLSIIEIFHVVFLIAHNYTKPINLQMNIKRKIIDQMNLVRDRNSNIKLVNEKLPQSNNLLFRSIYFILLFVSAILALYVTKERVTLYLSEPTRLVVTIQENETLYLPNLIACRDGQLMEGLREKYAKRTGKNVCEISFLDLIGEKYNVEKVWKAQTPKINYVLLNSFVASVGLKSNIKWKTVPMHVGTCQESEELGPIKYAGCASVVFFCFDKPFRNNCKHDEIEVYFRIGKAKLPSILTSKRSIKRETFSIITFKMFKNIRLNLTSQPCFGQDEYENCLDDCYEKNIYDFVDCSLPFMHDVGKNNCTNPEEAKTSLSTFVNNSIKIDLKKDCGCYPLCEQSVFDSYVYFQHPDAWPVQIIAIIPMNNIIEEIKQVLSYTIVALFCDVGNAFSLLLGLSILAIPQISQDFIVSMSKFFTKPNHPVSKLVKTKSHLAKT